MEDKHIEYILNNKIINQYFEKVPLEYRDDFRQFIWLIICEMDIDKINNLYVKNELGKFIIGIINNQLKSKTSSFHKIYRKNNSTILDDRLDYKYEEYEEKDNLKIINDIINLLDKCHWVDSILFKMYRGIDCRTNKLVKPMTYAEIENETGIKYQTVWYSINKITKIIKKEIKL